LRVEVIKNLKGQPRKDIIILGSPTFAQSLMKLDLIVEYRLTIHPVVLGSGKKLFKDVPNKMGLTLIGFRLFDLGVVCLTYQRNR
jgi:dihydrofolate reductase